MADNFRLPTDGVASGSSDSKPKTKPSTPSVTFQAMVRIARALWMLVPIPLIVIALYYGYSTANANHRLIVFKNLVDQYEKNSVRPAFEEKQKELEATQRKLQEAENEGQRIRNELVKTLDEVTKSKVDLKKVGETATQLQRRLDDAQSQGQKTCDERLQKSDEQFKILIDNEKRSLSNEKQQCTMATNEIGSKLATCNSELQSAHRTVISLQKDIQDLKRKIIDDKRDSNRSLDEMSSIYRSRLEKICRSYDPKVKRPEQCSEFK